MTTETLSIPLTDGEFSGHDHVSNPDDTQYVTVTDGGALTHVTFQSWGSGIATEPGQGPGGDDDFTFDLKGFDDDFSVSVKSMTAGDHFDISGAVSWSHAGDVYTINYIGSDDKTHSMEIDAHSTNDTGDVSVNITCFGAGTMIETSQGITPVEYLNCGDLVKCGDGQYYPIRWVSRRLVTAAEMKNNPDFRPILIAKDALYKNVPERDLIVSPQHRIVIDDWRAELLFGQERVLVPAVHLLNDRDITRDYSSDEVTYYHFMFDRHRTVFSNGLESESFFPGAEAIRGVEDSARAELFALFPELAEDPDALGETCCPTLKAHEAMAMVGL